jgi:hypothetical protein
MTTTATPAPARLSIGGAAITSVIGAVALNAFGLWGDGTSAGDGGEFREFVVVSGVIAVCAGLVFGLIVPRGLKRLESTGRSGMGGVVMAVLALLLLVPAFWSGLPPVLAAGAIVLGLAGRGASRAGLANAATAIGVLVIVGDLAIYALDWMSTNGAM